VACGSLRFRDRGKPLVTSRIGIFTIRERPRAAAHILPSRGIAVIYWVAYQRGSFSLKERYLCPERARSRCSDLITEARYIRIIPAEESEPHSLPHCFEIPAAS
jgi:hypothetical protein